MAGTPSLARLAAFPVRAVGVARHDAQVIGTSVRWLFTSREHHNFTYDLTDLNRGHLAWFVSQVCGVPVTSARAWFDELDEDHALRHHIEATTATSPRRGIADPVVRFGRRIGWYAMVRALRPAHVVETGTDKGLGTCVIATALLRNAAEDAPGRVTSIDINPESGYLARAEPWSTVTDLVVDDSIRTIGSMDRPVDVFLHDSDHGVEHERAEFAAVEPLLAPRGLLLTDNVAVSDVLAQHAEATGRSFLAFAERPDRHWFPGDGIGAAW